MKILLITAYIPTAENYRGISALEYHLIKYRPSNIDLSIICYNENKCNKSMIEKIEKDLDVKIKILEESKVEKFISRWHKLGRILSYILPRNTKIYSYNKKELSEVIKYENPDAIWLYPFFYADIANFFPHVKFVLTGSDCNSLFYQRWIDSISQSSSTFNLYKLKYILHQLKCTEYSYAKPNIHVHLVGKEDVSYYQIHTGYHNATFIHHPHYSIKNKRIDFGKNKLNILWAGNNDFYMKTDAKLVLNSLIENNISNIIKITFLGKNWDNAVSRLSAKGYECQKLEWVDDYISEIIKYDIQITPISLGTGTKGKVLDAIANGLLCIGSKYALENIEVEHMNSCIQYNHPSEVPSILTAIFEDKEKYENMAYKGRESVRRHHNPKVCASSFFKLFEK